MLRFAKALLASAVCVGFSHGQEPSIRLGESGRLEYGIDEQGNRIPNFSHCGYRGADRDIPHVAVKVLVQPSGKDDTERIQTAIHYVAQLEPREDGLRGAVMLGNGDFLVSGQLRIIASGVVLRGHGAKEGGTVVRATGRGRRSLIVVCANRDSDVDAKSNRSLSVVDEFVPSGATRIRLSSTEGLAKGQRIEVVHPSSQSWIAKLGIDRLGWREGTRDIRWKRTITAIDGDQIAMDAPLTLAIDKDVCQATVRVLHLSDRLRDVGIEGLTLVSDFDQRNPHDEDHAWYGINIQGVRDAWVQRVQFRHFAGGAVMLGDQTERITVADCASLAPVSEVGGYRRHTFFTQGQQCLFLRCWSEAGLHDFCVGQCAGGPNAFVHCYAKNALGDSGPRESCALGVLYDNVRIDGHALNLMNRWNSPPKTGWSAVNCLLWQCQAANVRCEKTPVGTNWAIGIWSTPSGNGHFEGLSEFVKPTSLYQQQLRERLGERAAERIGPFLLKPVSATNPSPDEAKKFSAQSAAPARQLIDLIRATWQIEGPALGSVPKLEDVESPSINSSNAEATSRLGIKNGWLTVNGKLLTGDHYTPMWWRGDLQRQRAKSMGPAITRFAPGRRGAGLTDDLDRFATHMANNNFVGYDHHYGLWYDRRRDDHLMVRRKDGEVVPPFYEQPFARSGKGTAWDGLSRYDLTKFNPWYWNRLRMFAELGQQREKGFVLFHHNYFQHNILEAGAHWADSPWRPSNNVNETGLPDPPPYVGDKRILLTEQFYDISNPQLRKLHRSYIRQCLNNFVGKHNVIQLTSGEYTGPLTFMEFWIDTIIQWEQETGQNAIIALSCTKDVQDAILNDLVRSRHIDVIDIRYWTYAADGEIYAPPGGKHLSPRQHLRQIKPASTSFDSIVRSVREYRQKCPGKAVTYNAHIHCGAERNGWAILIGGGSLPNVPNISEELSRAIVRMKPGDRLNLAERQWCLADGDREFLICSLRETPSQIWLPSDANWEWCSVNVNSGQVDDFVTAENGLIPVDAGTTIVWARRITN